ncbi:MAG: histidine--tRNA ligase [Candidatus Omnitrophica bacterium]|nr:histidine--tRNA ligase [Candidatus Omnitrophota bacterium]MDD5081632.1 histidine--tRNA ligase [Candidatus Omnitrophota bacterium]
MSEPKQFKKCQAIRGTTDFAQDVLSKFNFITDKARQTALLYGCEEINLPVLEDTSVFVRAVGEVTDIVEKQIFKAVRAVAESKQDIALRPEGTAQVIRYYIENALNKKKPFHKLFYTGPMFRGERPQKGRLRQFHHLGVEAIGGTDTVLIDADIIALAVNMLDASGVKNKTVKLNSLGCHADKVRLTENLKTALAPYKDELCPDCLRRVLTNPLRVIDCKEKKCREIIKALDFKDSHLCVKCKDEFDKLKNVLRSIEIAFEYDPFLVRGLDYYTNTVFEIVSSDLGSQDAVGAGGRYNNLISNLGGPNIPAVGFALGMERIMLISKLKVAQPVIDIYVAGHNDNYINERYALVKFLRNEGVSADMDYCSRSLKAQFRAAQKQDIKYIAVLGDDEIKAGKIMFRDMMNSKQEMLDKVEIIKRLISFK